jgi:hypothetical protein
MKAGSPSMARPAKLRRRRSDPEDNAFAKVHDLSDRQHQDCPGGSELTGRRWEQSRRFLFLEMTANPAS